MASARLRGLDLSAWADVSNHVQGLTCAWSDLDGWHVERCPGTEPAGATHLWGWSDERKVALRLGGYRIIGAELAFGDGAIGELVEISTSAVSPWPHDHKGVRVEHATGNYEVISVATVQGLWFVSQT